MISQYMNTTSDDLTILQVNCTYEEPYVLCNMCCKLDVCRKSTVIIVIIDNWHYRKIIVSLS